MLRFKVDENLPVEIAVALRAVGHDAHTVYEEALAGTPDPDLGVVITAALLFGHRAARR